MSENTKKSEQTSASSPSPHAFDENEVKEYEKKRYRGIDQRLVHRRETRILERFLGRIASDPGYALDVPCGYGRFSELFRKRGWSLISCDYSLSMVKRAIGSGESENLHNWGVVADAKQGLPFKKDIFPILLCMRFWHHVHDPAERKVILDFISSVNSEWLLLSFYRVNALHRLQRRFRRTLKRTPTRIKMISQEEFSSEVRGAGYECLNVIPIFPMIHAQHVALLKKIRI
jgi:SAM-dependent methyltransferase